MGCLRVSSASISALPTILTSAFSASDFLITIFSEALDDVSLTEVLVKLLNITNEQESPLDGTQTVGPKLSTSKAPKV